MSVLEKMTKAELLQQISELQGKLDNATRTVATEAPRPVVEANALRDCIRALDGLRDQRRNQSGYGMSTGYEGGTDIDRVLRHLAAKYGVPLIETRYEPCARAHIDQIDTYAISNAITAGLQNGAILGMAR